MKTKLDAAWGVYRNEVHRFNVKPFNMKFGPKSVNQLTDKSRGYLYPIQEWARCVGEIMGYDTTLEWEYGNCIVAGVMVFYYNDAAGLGE